MDQLKKAFKGMFGKKKAKKDEATPTATTEQPSSSTTKPTETTPAAPAPATAPEPAKSETAPASTGTAPAPAPAAAPVPAPVAAAPAQEEPKKDEAAPVAEVREATSSMYNPPSLFHLSQHTDILQPLSLLVPLRPLFLPPSPPRHLQPTRLQPPRRSPPRQPPQPPQPLKHPLPSQPHSLLLACPPPAVPWPSLTLALRRSRSPLLLLQLLQRLPPVPRPLRPLHLLRSRRFFVWRRRSCEEECSVLLVSRNLRV
jgi:hypothetical protein